MSPDHLTPDLTRQPLRFLAAYWTAWQGLSAQVQTALAREHGLDLRAFLILSHVQAGPQTPSDLARTLDLPRYEVARALRHLQGAGAVAHAPHPMDARRHALHVTPAGAQLWGAAMQTLQHATQPALTRLGSQLDAVTAGLETLSATPFPEATA
ncbi:MarR family winged helix-turn-helix transcriptional regulator [Deinococcus soli (ex Cha et al. 2016)]|uniref:MarR family winged helix-turn-helix transcriptional regulator n=1 Tax=Deinococcus soli (ex Cha et al. 2016) TaxID=1309411 RepID=UPI00166BCC5B|nr:MarR family winged helix-turn-helix transcriptional regulator [Deinococcus soli (ex Cha et al. 2016)]GGB54432.1 transcriptional regulator [Deinococcus soli (ex Cha et al. 2016)]